MKIMINKEKRVDDSGREYLYTEYEKKLPSGKPYSSIDYLPTPQEQQEQLDQARTEELRQLIADKKLLDMDVNAEQQELKALLKL